MILRRIIKLVEYYKKMPSIMASLSRKSCVDDAAIAAYTMFLNMCIDSLNRLIAYRSLNEFEQRISYGLCEYGFGKILYPNNVCNRIDIMYDDSLIAIELLFNRIIYYRNNNGYPDAAEHFCPQSGKLLHKEYFRYDIDKKVNPLIMVEKYNTYSFFCMEIYYKNNVPYKWQYFKNGDDAGSFGVLTKKVELINGQYKITNYDDRKVLNSYISERTAFVSLT